LSNFFSRVILLILFLVTATSSALAQSRVQIEPREENGFARIVMTFDRLPEYKNAVESGIFVLSFDQPVEADVSAIPTDLPEYIGLARLDPDGRAIRMALNRTYNVNLMEAGDELYIDILPPDWKGHPPPLPTHVIKALSRLAAIAERETREKARQIEAAKDPPTLEIRLSSQPTFTRLIFDWSKFVTVNLGRQGRQVSLRFGAQVKASLAALKTDAPKFLRDVDLQQDGAGMVLNFTVDDDTDVRGFREGLTYIVDLTGSDVAATSSANKMAETLGKETEELKNKATKSATDKASLPGKSNTDPGEGGGANNTAVTTQSGKMDATALKSDGLDKNILEQPVAEKKLVESAEEVAGDQPAKVIPPEVPIANMPMPVRKPEPLAAPAPKPHLAKPHPGKNVPVLVNAEDNGGNLKLTFPFTEAVSAAAFRRGSMIWLIFDTAVKLDIEAIRDVIGAKVSDVQHVRTRSMQYLRIQLSRSWLAYVQSDDTAWVVDIGDMVGGKSETVSLQRKLRTDKRSVIGISLKNPGRIHWMTDPEIGDRLAIVTAFAPQRSVAKPQEFVEFRALATAHGIAIRPNSDDIAVRLQLDEVIITRRRGLTLSAGNTPQYMAGRKPLVKAARVGFIDNKSWLAKSAAQFSDRLDALQNAVALSAESEKNKQRFALARVYFANNHAMEALGVMKRMANVDPSITNDPSYNVLRGAALTLVGRTDEARKDFEVHALAHDSDAALWRGLLDVADKNWEEALRNFEEGADSIYSYSRELQARFRLATARAALELKRLNTAADALDAMPANPGSATLAADAKVLRGWYLERIGRTGEALEEYAKVMKGNQRAAEAEAKLRRISLLLNKGKMPRAEALEKLEGLQMSWRGDDIELGTMRMLASIYVEERRYRDAFNIMKNGIIAYPESSLAVLIQDEMKQVFKRLFLKGDADKMDPIKSLALYYDFRQMTPVGRQGDEMIRRLSDRLVKFDLLDQASDLLDHQVNNRLRGAARAQVATRLGMIHLMNHKPEQALRTIRLTRQAGLPAVLKRSRNMLEARALGDLGRAEAAIEILNTMEGAEIERLKADALWNAQKWQQTAQQLEKMLGPRWQENKELNDTERFDVLRAAIGYSLSGDQFALDRLSKKFYEKMVKTGDAGSFVIVTKPIKSQGISFRQLAKEIAATDTLDSFMKEFRAQYGSSDGAATTRANSNRKAG